MKKAISLYAMVMAIVLGWALPASAIHVIEVGTNADCDGYEVAVTAEVVVNCYALVHLELTGDAGTTTFDGKILYTGFPGGIHDVTETLTGSWGDLPCGDYTVNGTVELYNYRDELRDTAVLPEKSFSCDCVCGDGYADPGEECGEPGLECEPGYVCDVDNCVCIPEPEGEGCTPGYWKQDQHFGSWVGYVPGYPGDMPEPSLFSDEDAFDTIITIKWKATKGKPQDLTDPTLLQALEANGGGINELARHAAAALLNIANPDVAYPLSLEDVLEAFDEGDAGVLVDANESGCPLARADEELSVASGADAETGAPTVGGCSTVASVTGSVAKEVNLSLILLGVGAILLQKRIRRRR